MFESIWEHRGLLLEGLGATLLMVLLSALISLPVGALVAMARLSPNRLVRAVSLVYIEVFRSIPVLVLMIALFYALGRNLQDLGINAFWTAVIALSLNESAYLGDAYRGLLGAIPDGQWRAAASFGFTRAQAYRRIIIPQALAASVPQSVNGVIYLLKSSALASLITVHELVAKAYSVMYQTFQPFEVLFGVLIIYVIVATVIAYIPSFMKGRVNA